MEKAEGIYVLWLESEKDRKRMMDERQRNNMWRQFFIKEWMSTEKWVRKTNEEGESLRRL